MTPLHPLHCNYEFYHGSENTDITALAKDPRSTAVFGSAIYATNIYDVAKCYQKRTGAIYHLALLGRPELTLDFDAPFYQQSKQAQAIVLKARRRFGLSTIVDRCENTRSVVHPFRVRKNEMNDELLEHGIWMVYGHVDVYEHSGRQDNGVQYAVLNENMVSILDKEIAKTSMAYY